MDDKGMKPPTTPIPGANPMNSTDIQTRNLSTAMNNVALNAAKTASSGGSDIMGGIFGGIGKAIGGIFGGLFAGGGMVDYKNDHAYAGGGLNSNGTYGTDQTIEPDASTTVSQGTPPTAQDAMAIGYLTGALHQRDYGGTPDTLQQAAEQIKRVMQAKGYADGGSVSSVSPLANEQESQQMLMQALGLTAAPGKPSNLNDPTQDQQTQGYAKGGAVENHPGQASQMGQDHIGMAKNLIMQHPGFAAKMIEEHPGFAKQMVEQYPGFANQMMQQYPGFANQQAQAHPGFMNQMAMQHPGTASQYPGAIQNNQPTPAAPPTQPQPPTQPPMAAGGGYMKYAVGGPTIQPNPIMNTNPQPGSTQPNMRPPVANSPGAMQPQPMPPTQPQGPRQRLMGRANGFMQPQMYAGGGMDMMGQGEPDADDQAFEGEVKGPGGPTDDLVPARLSNGEFVMSAPATAFFGVDKLVKMNEQGKQGFMQAKQQVDDNQSMGPAAALPQAMQNNGPQQQMPVMQAKGGPVNTLHTKGSGYMC